MKKVLVSIIACIIFVFVLAECNNDTEGTYYPTDGEMKNNLENGGYSVTVTTDLDGRAGTRLSAKNGVEYIEFYWLVNSADCDYFYNLLEETYPDSNHLVQIANDEKFGNIVYCGTENAVEAAGIRVVKVNVKV